MYKKMFSVLLVLMMVVGVISGCAAPAASSATKAPSAAGQSAAASSAATTAASAAASGTIKIGIGVPLTGGSAELGGRVEKGAKLAVQDINAAGGINGQKLELVEMDDRADPKEAANVANLFVADKSIIACIAGYNSACTLAGAPIYNAAKMVHIAVGSSSPKVSDAGDYTFRMWNSDIYRAAFDLQIVLDKGYKTVGIMYQNDDFGLGALKVAQDMLKTAGIANPVSEGFLLGETKDFNTMITKMKNAKCDAIFCIADESELAAFAKQCAQQGFKPFITSTGTYNPAVIKLGGADVEGMVGDGFYDPANLPAKAADFYKKYKAAYNDDAQDPTSPCAYDTIYMIAAAIKNGAKTREDIQKYLATLKDFQGVVGTLSFDAKGDVKIPLVYLVIKNGKFELYK